MSYLLQFTPTNLTYRLEMNPQTWAILGTIILLGVILVFYLSPSYAPKITAAAMGPYPLTSTQTIIKDIDAQPYYSDANGSFSAYVYLNPMNRTGAYAPCGTNPNQASCADGTFAPCPCDPVTSDCTTTCNHSGYSSVFNIAGIVGLEVLIAPDASRQGKAMSQLIVKTEGAPVSVAASTGASQKYIETLTLPPIHLQKWTMVTVAREGRRFDVYYDDTIVLSQKTMYMPVSNISNSNFRGITSGSAGLVGQLCVANVYNYRINSQQVVANHTATSDTRGRPYIGSTATSSGTVLSKVGESPTDITGMMPTAASSLSSSVAGLSSLMTFCPKGGCFSAPTVRPASPLYDWSTSYG